MSTPESAGGAQPTAVKRTVPVENVRARIGYMLLFIFAGTIVLTFVAAALMNAYALWLGIDILMRGIRSNSIARANFGLVLIAALAISRFFDSELSFIIRGLGFILVGAGFLVANMILFKRRGAAATA